MTKSNKDMDTRIRIKDASVLAFFEEMAEKESQRQNKYISRNQVIIDVLTSYMSQSHRIENPLLISLEDKIDHQTLLIEELIDIVKNDFIPSIQKQTETYQEILKVLLQ